MRSLEEIVTTNRQWAEEECRRNKRITAQFLERVIRERGNISVNQLLVELKDSPPYRVTEMFEVRSEQVGNQQNVVEE